MWWIREWCVQCTRPFPRVASGKGSGLRDYIGSTSVLPEYGGGSDSPAITVSPRPPLLECRGCGQSNAREWKIAATA